MASRDVRVLSIDVGVRNLAFCEFIVSSSSARIVRWEVIDVIDKKKPTFDELSAALLNVLNDRFMMQDDADVRIDHVIIEHQPVTMNPKIKSVAIMIYTFFKSMNLYTGLIPCVRFVSAQRKLQALQHRPPDMDVVLPTASVSYADKKRMARVLCEFYLDHVMDAQEARATLTKAAKKDDLCDCFLQGIAFMEKDVGWQSCVRPYTT